MSAKVSPSGRVLLCWYYHAPSVMSDQDVADQIRESLEPLLRAHTELDCPVTLAFSGNYVERLNTIRPDVVDDIRKGIERNVVEVAGAFYFEVHPGLIPVPCLRRHVFKDQEIKRSVFDIDVTSFLPANFTWVSFLSPILNEIGVKNIILDSRHFHYCNTTQIWKWSERGDLSLESVSAPIPEPPGSHHSVYSFSSGVNGQEELSVFFRDWEITKKFSFGNSAILHEPYSDEKRERFIEEMVNSVSDGKLLTLADDGDRINPVSLLGYEGFLEKMGSECFALISSFSADVQGRRIIDWIPSFSIGDMETFWIRNLDSRQYVEVLNEIYRLGGKREVVLDKLLELQDVYYLFWHNKSEKKEFLQKAWNLLNSLHGC